MLLPEAKLEPIKVSSQKPTINWFEFCEKIEPKPLYCETPEDLKLSFRFAEGTASDNMQYLNPPYSITGTASTTHTQTFSAKVFVVNPAK